LSQINKLLSEYELAAAVDARRPRQDLPSAARCDRCLTSGLAITRFRRRSLRRAASPPCLRASHHHSLPIVSIIRKFTALNLPFRAIGAEVEVHSVASLENQNADARRHARRFCLCGSSMRMAA